MVRIGLALALLFAVVAGAANAKTPYPPPTAGSGKEPTAGSGRGAGLAFRPHFALATYDSINGTYVIYLTPKRTSCANAVLAQTPYLTISIVTAGLPLVVGRASLQRGSTNFVQMDFFVARTHYYTVQPGVRLVLTRVAAASNSVWHGRISVPRTDIEGKLFVFSGTFAAHWCGRT